MSLSWFRMYAEFAMDAKVQSMSEAMQRRLVMVFCLRCSDVTVTLCDEEIAFQLRISEHELAETKALFMRKGFIDDSWNPKNWDKRQYASDSSAARTRAYRERQKNKDVTSPKRPRDLLDTDTDTDTEKATPIVPTGDESEILSAYREHLPNCQGVSVLNPKRRRRIRDAIKLARSVCAAQGWPYEATRFWHAYFSECARDPWMRGEVKNPNNPNWKQNLDVLIAEDRFAGVMDRAIERLKAAA